MRTLKFKNNDEMPVVGLGTWKSNAGEVYKAVKIAIKQGYRHIDCASAYKNEKEIGQAIADCIADGIIHRSELWITSKLWSNSHAKDDVIPALKESLCNLQIEYLDLYLIHWQVALKKEVFSPRSPEDLISLNDIPLSETWQGMEKAVSEGYAKHIGVSNCGIRNLESLFLNSSIKPEINQVESHPYFQQEGLFSFCKSHNIFITAYAPLGSFDRPFYLKAKDEPKLLDDPIIAKIAKIRNFTPAQILISWSLNRGISVIPKSVNEERIIQNFEAENIRLSESELDKIDKLEKGYRYITGEFWVFENGPYTLEDIWA